MSTHQLCGVSSYFNPAGCAIQLIDYWIFRSFQPIPLVTAELSFDGSFGIGERDANHLLRYEDGDVM